MNKGNKNSEDRKFIEKCFHILWIISANETTPPSQTRLNRGYFLSFNVVITTNQIHTDDYNDIPYIEKVVSQMILVFEE